MWTDQIEMMEMLKRPVIKDHSFKHTAFMQYRLNKQTNKQTLSPFRTVVFPTN